MQSRSPHERAHAQAKAHTRHAPAAHACERKLGLHHTHHAAALAAVPNTPHHDSAERPLELRNPLRRICAEALAGRRRRDGRLVQIQPHHGRLRLAIELATSDARSRQEASSRRAQPAEISGKRLARRRLQMDVDARLLANSQRAAQSQSAQHANDDTHSATRARSPTAALTTRTEAR